MTLVSGHLPFTGPEPADPAAVGLCAVVAPGFSGAIDRPYVRRVADGLRPYAGVVLLEMRGHGRSGGRSTMGDREALDVDAAVASARSLGYRQVVTVGWSMGGSAVIRQAGLTGRGEVYGHPVTAPVDAVVAVSTTSSWFVRDTAPMRRIHRMVETPTGRLLARGVFKVRIDSTRWKVLPAPPLELVARIAPRPLLVVHGDSDGYLTLEHPHALYEAAGEPKELWIVPGFGHAEAAAPPELVDRIGRHLGALVGAARTAREQVPPCP